MRCTVRSEHRDSRAIVRTDGQHPVPSSLARSARASRTKSSRESLVRALFRTQDRTWILMRLLWLHSHHHLVQPLVVTPPVACHGVGGFTSLTLPRKQPHASFFRDPLRTTILTAHSAHEYLGVRPSASVHVLLRRRGVVAQDPHRARPGDALSRPDRAVRDPQPHLPPDLDLVACCALQAGLGGAEPTTTRTLRNPELGPVRDLLLTGSVPTERRPQLDSLRDVLLTLSR